MTHTKRIASPATWDIKRKKHKFVVRANPGSHKRELSVPLKSLLTEIIKIAKTRKEVLFILNNQEVLVDGRKCTELKRPIGLFDTLSFPEADKHYRVVLNKKKKITAIPITKGEANIKLVKIENKHILGKDKIQLALSDGRSLTVKKDTYKTNDSLFIELPSQKIVAHNPYKKGSAVYLAGGKHAGIIGSLKEISGRTAIVEHNKEEIYVNKRHLFAIGDKPLITIQK